MILFEGEGAQRDETRYRLEASIVADAVDGPRILQLLRSPGQLTAGSRPGDDVTEAS